MTRSCAWCGGPVVGRRLTCSGACRTARSRGTPRPLRLVHTGRELGGVPVLREVAAGDLFRHCTVCAAPMLGRRSHATTCSQRCRMARSRGAGALSLAEVYTGRSPKCGCKRAVWVWLFRPAPGEAGLICCTSCAVEQLAEVRARGWEAEPEVEAPPPDIGEDLDQLDPDQLIALFGHEMADEDEDESVTPVTVPTLTPVAAHSSSGSLRSGSASRSPVDN